MEKDHFLFGFISAEQLLQECQSILIESVLEQLAQLALQSLMFEYEFQPGQIIDHQPLYYY